jgi:FlaA1/EpsC-like NDP-sugar epimerase
LQNRRFRNRHLLVGDSLALIASPLIAFALRFESLDWIGEHPSIVLPFVAITLPVRLSIFYTFGLYQRLWRHAGVSEMRQIVLAAACASAAGAFLGLVLLPGLAIMPGRLPYSVAFLDAMLMTAAVAMPRLLLRARSPGWGRRRSTDRGRPVLVVGAGMTGKLVVKELLSNPGLKLRPIGFVDDDPTKHNLVMCDLPVFGSLNTIPEVVERNSVSEIIIAMPSAPGPVVRQVVRAALDCGAAARTVPSLPEILSAKVSQTSLREIEIQDLLRRDPIETDLAAVAELATGETVLITGAGGSIGSELCRQLARLAPARLVLLGHGENSIFDILHELRKTYGDVEVVPVIADVRDRQRMMRVCSTYRPYAIFHAAAHKHVPLMEDNVAEAITNNVLGTMNMVDTAVESGAHRFVFVSTDKAVRPTSIMGASKRVAEQLVQHAAMKHHRNFVSVRFGNVLGSRGSVVPTFLRQIREGGPLTVTHPEMQRYFMTIPEAVQLVLQAGALGRGGEVFVLDMGEPVRVVDIATDLIRLSGLEIGTDIEIQFTGIRPGEKLYEEMFFTAEYVVPTEHGKVLRARNGALPEGLMRRVETLLNLATKGDSEPEIRRLLRGLVPDFRPHGPDDQSYSTPLEFIAPIEQRKSGAAAG